MKHLKERIAAARSRLLQLQYEDDEAKPAAVVKAESVVRAWALRRNKAMEAKRNNAIKAVRETEEAMYFGDPDKAVAKVKWLESFKA